MINLIPDNCKDLEYHQKLMVYEGIGYMVSTEQQNQAGFVIQLLQYANQDWMKILQRANMNTNELMAPEVIKSVDHIIKINQRVA